MVGDNDLATVVHVIDGFSFVINRGSNDGIKLNDNFLIIRLGDDIFDSETEKFLGELEIVIGRAKATHVQDAMATLRSTLNRVKPGKIRKIRRHGTGLLAITQPLEEEVEEGREIMDLPIDVRVDDLARLI